MAGNFQRRVDAWIRQCFGDQIRDDKMERNHRLLEEALETVQTGGCTASEAHQLVDYVFGRPVGEKAQEVGGVMNTLAAWCNAHGVDLESAAEAELDRCWANIEKIRAKQAAKPKHSPLPAHPTEPPFPVGPETNSKRAGWQAYHDGKPRDACPFPADRRDLKRGFEAGWDIASVVRADDA
jgi:hypothetical protein